ncbi:hypothetical protein [Phytohabitans kaempferiae]|uniref:Uncharacterized protein n=1 Tax=Phytohabitans kaempferiae TaxID=1620943 RepID=A0ABV6M3D1_9ACTN
MSSAAVAALGMIIIEYSHWHVLYSADFTRGVERFGGLLIGVGAALVVAQPLAYRIVVAAPLGAATALITSIDTTGVLGVIYVLAVMVWWLQRLWHLVERRPLDWQPDG